MNKQQYIAGDWVRYKGTYKEPIVKVIEAREDKVMLDLMHQFYLADYSEIEHIPLTSEILGKSGWKLREDFGEYWFIQDEADLRPNIHEFDVLALNYICDDWSVYIEDTLVRHLKIKYVHELQHLLQVLGIENEINI